MHALIIGISDYPHLTGGAGPLADDPGGMGQLAVSASTAAQAFDWLNRQGEFAGRPLTTCRLALAPRPLNPVTNFDETAFVEAITGGWSADARQETLRSLLQGWADEFTATPADRTGETAAVFLFSGHGLQVRGRPALLSADILRPKSSAGRTNAIRISSLTDSLKSYGAGAALFLFDCCRNAPEVAKRLNIEGQEVLEPTDQHGAPCTASVWLRATSVDRFAFQDPNNARRASLFGQAVLEALDAQPPDWTPYDRADVPWRLRFDRFASHVKERTRELLRDLSATKLQPVEEGGDPNDAAALISRLNPPVAAASIDDPVDAGFAAAAGDDAGAEPADAGEDTDWLLTRSPGFTGVPVDLTKLQPWSDFSAATSLGDAPALDAGAEPEDQSEAVPPSAEELVMVRGDRLLAGLQAFAVPAGERWSVKALSDFTPAHDLLRSEQLTDPWLEQVTLTDLAGAPLEDDALVPASSWVSPDLRTAWIDLELAPGEGAIWFALCRRVERPRAEGGWVSLAAVLPRDRLSRVPVRLDLGFEAGLDGRFYPDTLSARLGPAADHIWSPLWELQRTLALTSIGEAANALAAAAATLEETLRGKEISPLAAATAAAMLLQAGQLERLHDWPRNLSNRFRDLAEGPVLWAETLLLRAQVPAGAPASGETTAGQERAAHWASERWSQPVVQEAAEHMARLAERGAPRLAPVLAMAAARSEFWARLALSKVPPPDVAAALLQAVAVIEEAAEDFTGEGLFAAFRSEALEFGPPLAYSAPLRKDVGGEA